MELREMKEQIRRTEKCTERNLLTVDEANQRITRLIEEALPLDGIMLLDEETKARLEEQRRLAYRRLWRFLLKVTRA